MRTNKSSNISCHPRRSCHHRQHRLAQTQASTRAPTTYTHDNQGLRLRKHGTLSAAGDTGTLAFVYDHSPTAGGLPSSYPHLLGEYNASGQPVREYIWLGDTPVAIAMADPANPLGPPKLYAIHTDHLNTPQVVMDRSNAAMRWRWMTEPFGTTKPEESINGTAAFTQPLRFPGQYADGETGMAYNVMRSYIPGVGRYSQSDPIGLEGGINTYGYVSANPLSSIDPMGLDGTSARADRVAGIPYGRDGDKYDPNFSITKRGICDGSNDPMCAAGMAAAGLPGPYFGETKTFSTACILSLGVAVKGGGAVAGNAVANQVPKVALQLGAGARAMSWVVRGVSIFTNPATAGASLGYAIGPLLEHCEVKPPVCEAK